MGSIARKLSCKPSAYSFSKASRSGFEQGGSPDHIKEFLASKGKHITDDEALGLYKRLMGEAEARKVQGRMLMNEKERAANFPMQQGPYGYDIPMTDLLTRDDIYKPGRFWP